MILTDRSPDPSRSPRLWIRRGELIALLVAAGGPPVAAWAYRLAVGLPPTAGNFDPANPHGPHPYPAAIRAWHYANNLLAVALAVTGVRILAGRPRLAWTTGGPAWFRCRPFADEAAPAPSWLRFGHALLAVAWATTGLAYVGLLALAGARDHLVPQSWRDFPEAWRVFVQYATFHLPLDPDGFYRFNSLQLLSYATVMFGLVPLIVVTGLATSPAFGRPFDRLARLFGNAEAARSVHHLAILGYVAFIAIHVTFVAMYAAWLNGHHVVMGTDETGLPGWLSGGVGGAGLVLAGLAARRVVRRAG